MRALLACLVFAGCATDAADPCSEAASHVASCTGEASAMAPESTCDAERAETLLAMDCEQLANASLSAKADGWWDEFMCSLGFSSWCSTPPGGGSGSGSSMPTTRALTGVVYKFGTVDGVGGALIRINDLDTGAITTATSAPGGLFHVGGLARHKFSIGAVGGQAQTVDLSATGYVTLYVY